MPSFTTEESKERAWFMPPDIIDGEAWTREVAVVEMGRASSPYWWVMCPQTTTLVLRDGLSKYPLRGNGGDDCSAAGCEWDEPHAWAKSIIDARRAALESEMGSSS